MRTSILPLPTFHTASLCAIKSRVRLLRPCPELRWVLLETPVPRYVLMQYSVHHCYGSSVSVPLTKIYTLQRHGFCLLHLLSSVLSTDLGLESTLEKYLIEDCVKKWGWVESRRRVLKIQCNYSRNWVTIIRPLALRLKINKQTKRNANFPNSWYGNL